MNILILSDSHGRADFVGEAVERCKPDLVLFSGDGLRDLAYTDLPCPLFAVRGNCDFSPPPLPHGGEATDELLIPIEGMKILLLHGHNHGVKVGLGRVVQRAVQLDADAVVFGHTHLPLDVRLSPDSSDGLGALLTKPLYLFNPGSLRDYPHSFGVLTLRQGVPLFSHGQLD